MIRFPIAVAFAAFCLVFSVSLSPAASIALADLVLSVDDTGHAAIVNENPTQATLDGYMMSCQTGCLDPVGWYSIEDHVRDDALGVLTGLSAGALGFAEANPSQTQLSEITLGTGAVLQPGGRIDLGQPILTNGDVTSLINSGQLSWQWTAPGQASPTSGAIVSAVPEPSAFVSLLVVALIACARRPWSASKELLK